MVKLSDSNKVKYVCNYWLSLSIRHFSTKDGLESVNFLEKETFRDIQRRRRFNQKKGDEGKGRTFKKKFISNDDESRVKPRSISGKSNEKQSYEQSNRKSAAYREPHRSLHRQTGTNSNSPVNNYIERSPESWKKPLPSSKDKPITAYKPLSKPSSKPSSKPHPTLSPFLNFSTQETPYFSAFELDSTKLSYSPLEVPNQPKVPKLAHNLDRVLFSPGVHVLKDIRTNVYNFTPYLENIMSIKDFDFDFIAKYVPSGKDSTLARIAKENGKKYTGSTSSLTSVLTQFHHLLSHKRKPHTMSLSKYFKSPEVPFSAIQTMPVSLFLRYNPLTDTHSIDSDKSHSDDIIVSILGHQLEAMLTTPEKEFENYRKTLSHNLDPSLKGGLNTYNYTQSGDLLMRSQLDCYDERLPGTGMFDLKTRAVCAVRHDMDYTQIHDGSNYQINKLDGEFESFSREWFELIRSTMFKYSLQARIGRMDGIFIAYHNIRKMFGFQYVPLSDIDQIFHTSNLISKSTKMDNMEPSKVSHYLPLDNQMAISGPLIAENEFKLSLKLLNNCLDKIVKSHELPATSFNLVFHTSSTGRMHIFVKPMLEKDIEIIQQVGCEEPSEASQTEEYSSNSDPHTIIMHANKNPEFLPPDIKLYQLDIRTYVNDQFIPGDQHPHLSNESDVWKVQCHFNHVPHSTAQKRFSKSFTNFKNENRITSTPQTERLDQHQEESLRTEALSKLAPPTAKQEYLRFLSVKGENFEKQWNDLYGDKEKQLWMPKHIERVL